MFYYTTYVYWYLVHRTFYKKGFSFFVKKRKRNKQLKWCKCGKASTVLLNSQIWYVALFASKAKTPNTIWTFPKRNPERALGMKYIELNKKKCWFEPFRIFPFLEPCAKTLEYRGWHNVLKATRGLNLLLL